MQAASKDSGRRARGIVVLLAATAAALAVASANPAMTRIAAADEAKPSTVRLVIDYGDGVELHFTALPWRSGINALDALTAVQSHKRGVKFVKRGSGSSALVTQIGDLANEGGGASSRNWLYSINGKSGEVSAGAHELKAGDVVLWRFQVYEYNP